MKWIKYVLLGLLLTTLTEPIFAQKIRFPTNVRYVAGGYTTNRTPYFNSLEYTLNNVKPFATAENPYVFWVDSDTLQIHDWDSVFTASGLTMKDSIDIYYVATGKVKWGGFAAQGTGGGGGAVIVAPEGLTTHYSLWTWTGQSSLATWQTRLGLNADSIDLKLWELIVYTDSVYLYIENDTLKFRAGSLSASGWNPDTTTVVRTTGNQSIAGDKTHTGGLLMGVGGYLRSPSAYSASYHWWRTASGLYYYNAVDTLLNLFIDNETGELSNDSLITWQNINDAVKDSMSTKWWLQFSLDSDPAHSEGRIFYDSSAHALSVYNDESEVKLSVGSEIYIRVYNASATDTIFNGYPVYPSGVAGVETGAVSIAKADVDATSNVIGLATHDIEPQTFGYITRFGYVHDLVTTGMTPGGTVYLSATIAGGLTTTKPDAPNTAVPLGGVTRVDDDSGSVFIVMDRFNPINGYTAIGFVDSSYTIDLTVSTPLQITNASNNLFIENSDIAHDVTLSGDSLTLVDAGVYIGVISHSFQGANTGIYKFFAKLDGTIIPNAAANRLTSTADVGNVGYNFAVKCTAGQVLTFWVENTNSSTDATMISSAVIVYQVR